MYPVTQAVEEGVEEAGVDEAGVDEEGVDEEGVDEEGDEGEELLTRPVVECLTTAAPVVECLTAAAPVVECLTAAAPVVECLVAVGVEGDEEGVEGEALGGEEAVGGDVGVDMVGVLEVCKKLATEAP